MHYVCPNCGYRPYSEEDNCRKCGYLHPKEMNEEKGEVQITFCPDCGCYYSQPCKTHQSHLRKKKDSYAKADWDKTMEDYIKIINDAMRNMPVFGSPWPSNPLNKVKP